MQVGEAVMQCIPWIADRQFAGPAAGERYGLWAGDVPPKSRPMVVADRPGPRQLDLRPSPAVTAFMTRSIIAIYPAGWAQACCCLRCPLWRRRRRRRLNLLATSHRAHRSTQIPFALTNNGQHSASEAGRGCPCSTRSISATQRSPFSCVDAATGSEDGFEVPHAPH